MRTIHASGNVVQKKVTVTHKSHGKVISTTTVNLASKVAHVAQDSPDAAQTAPMPTIVSAKPTAKAVQSKATAQRAEPQPTIHTSPRMSKVGSGNGGHHQTFTYGGQTVVIH